MSYEEISFKNLIYQYKDRLKQIDKIKGLKLLTYNERRIFRKHNVIEDKRGQRLKLTFKAKEMLKEIDI